MGLDISISSFPKNAKIIVGCSGGVDSVVLAYCLHAQNFEIVLAHCHFNLRGEAANADQDLVKNLAQQLQVPFHTTQFNTKEYAAAKGISIQMAARDLRYLWFEKIRQQLHFHYVAVGTNLSDSVETFIFNSTKGTGLAGLRGIKEHNQHVVRPLINLSKEEIYAFAKKQNLQWREDASNAETKYARNKIRHQVIPVLKEINPNLTHTFGRTFKGLQQIENYLNAHLTADWEAITHKTENHLAISIVQLSHFESPQVVLNFGLQPLGFTTQQIEDLLGAIHNVGAVFHSKSHQAQVDRTHIYVLKQSQNSNKDSYLIHEFLGEISNPIKLRFSDDFVHGTPDFSNKNRVFFDFDTLKFPLTLRKWKDGDKLMPLGMKGKKKVSDLLIDAKIPRHQKENTWVLESNNKIAWVVGLRTADHFKITTKTTRIYSIEQLFNE